MTILKINKQNILFLLFSFFFLFSFKVEILKAENVVPEIIGNNAEKNIFINVKENDLFVTDIEIKGNEDNFTYYLFEDKKSNYNLFTINSNTGVLSLKEKINFKENENNNYWVEIIVKNNNDESLIDKVKINIIITEEVLIKDDIDKISELIFSLEGGDIKEIRKKIEEKMLEFNYKVSDFDSRNSIFGFLEKFFNPVKFTGDFKDKTIMEINKKFPEKPDTKMKKKEKTDIGAVLHIDKGPGKKVLKKATTTKTTKVSSGTNNEGGLVACDPKNGVETCNLNTMYETVKNVISFLTKIGYMAVTLAIVWAGVIILTAGGETKARADAKKIFKNALIGMVLIAAASAIISLILSLFIEDNVIKENPLLREVESGESI